MKAFISLNVWTLMKHIFFQKSLNFLSYHRKINFFFNLSLEELSEAVQCMNGGKAPKPDRLAIKIYRTFQKGSITPS